MEDDKDLSVLLISMYLEMMGTNINEASSEILPHQFMSSQDYELKNRILLEAIEKKIRVTQTSLYVQIEEGVLKNSR